MLVSIVIPCYRGGDYLEEAIDSVARQSYTDWELILVDNGLQNGFPEIRVPSEKLKLLTEARPGITMARNAGIRSCSGAYVAFLDEDDRWLPEKLASQVALFEANENAMVCHSAYYAIDAAGARIGRHGSPISSYRQLAGKGGGILPSAAMLRTSAFERCGLFDASFDPACDFEFFLRVLRHGDALVVEEPMMEYRHHGDNTSRGYLEQYKQAQRALRIEAARAFTLRRATDLYPCARGSVALRRGFSGVARARMIELAQKGAWRDAAKQGAQMLRLDPSRVFGLPVDGWRITRT